MQFIFGWDASTIRTWVRRITKVFVYNAKFQEFRRFPTPEEQNNLNFKHAAWVDNQHENGRDNLTELYNTRMNFMEDDVDCKEDDEGSFCKRMFKGALGAIDGTYTITARWPAAVQNLMYTGYKKFHAYKLIVICSVVKPVILKVMVVPAKVSDVRGYIRVIRVTLQLLLHALGSLVP